MASPAYVIGKGEMLLITTRWADGDVVMLETAVRCYTQAEVQNEIDSAISERCSVIAVDRYDMARRVGEDISEDFDIRSQEERDEEAAALQAARPAPHPYSTLNFAQTGVAGGYGR